MSKEMIREAFVGLLSLPFCSIRIIADKDVRIERAKAIVREPREGVGYTRIKPGNKEAEIDDGIYAEITTRPGVARIVRDHLPTVTQAASAEYEAEPNHFEQLRLDEPTHDPKLKVTMIWTPATTPWKEKGLLFKDRVE